MFIMVQIVLSMLLAIVAQIQALAKFTGVINAFVLQLLHLLQVVHLHPLQVVQLHHLQEDLHLLQVDLLLLLQVDLHQVLDVIKTNA